MGVDAEIAPGDAGGDDPGDDVADLRRLGAAIGVAQHNPARAGLVGGPGAGERIGRVLLEAVEEVLAVDHRLAAGVARGRDRGRDGFEVLLVGAAERDAHLVLRALGDVADRVGLRLQQRGDARIVGGRHAGALGHAEGDEGRAACALLLEEGAVGWVGARIAALDIVDAELVQHGRDRRLVLDGEVDARRLLAVAQRGVEEVDAFFHHGFAPANLSVA